MQLTPKQARLMQWMAQQNLRPRKPSADDQRKYNPAAVRMLTYVACLNYAVIDLEAELSQAGLLRQTIYHRVRSVCSIISRVHDKAYQMLYTYSNPAGRQYNEEMDKAYKAISAAVLLDAPERSYNIILALCRLIEQLNRFLSGRYDFAPARDLYRIPSLLDVVPFTDHRIDRIIEIATT